MKNSLKLLFILLTWVCTSASAQIVPWISTSYFPQPPQSSQNQDLFFLGAELDEGGNSYVSYVADEDIVFNNQTYPAVFNLYNGFLVKYDANGAVLWVRHIAPTPGEQLWIYDITLDNQNNLYAAISFKNSIIVDGVTVNSPSGTNDYCIAKWDSAGTLQWVVNGGGSGRKAALGLAVDSEGSLVVGGYWKGTSTIGSYSFTPNFSTAHFTAFLAKYSASGSLVWVKSAVNNHADAISLFNRVKLDAADNVYLYGNYTQSFSLGNLALVQQGAEPYCEFWMKCDPSGEPMVMKGFDVGHGVPTSMEVDEAGNSYLASSHYGNLTLGNTIFAPPSPGGIYSTYVYKLDPNGVVQWVTDMSDYGATGPNGSNAGARIFGLDRDKAGKIYIAGTYTGSMQIGGQQMPLDSASGVSAFIASLNEPTGTFNWAAPVTGGQFMHTVSLAANANAGVVFGAMFRITGNPIQVGGAQTTPVGGLYTNQTFLARVLNNYNTITGHVFADINLNGIQDSTETGNQSGHIVTVNPTQSAFVTNATGNFSANTGIGSFQLVPSPIQYYTYLPLGLTNASFSSFGNVAGGYNFAMQPIPNQQDMELYLTNLQPARPGFSTSYRITFKNPGTVAIPLATVSFSFDSLFTFQSGSQIPVQSGNTLTWTINDLQPLQTQNVDVVLQLSAQAPLNLPVTSTASITPLTGDLTPANNSDSRTTIITGSYDPNSIEVDLEQLTPTQVQNEQLLNYTIRFQNMGTDTAFTVMLRDSLPANLLNLGSIELLASSHTCTWNLDAAGVMTVMFTNIRLPHETIDTLGSNGFVRFRIKPRTTLVVGDIVPNQAHIYFDYNAPITTNVAETQVVQPSFIADEIGGINWQLYPNPASNTVTVRADLSDFAEVKLRVLNTLGQEVLRTKARTTEGAFQQELNLYHLPPGMYSVQLQTPQGSTVKRLVKQ